MLLSSFNIENFRNFEHIQVEFDDNCNIFYGKNGSGKTSFLEAIYYLVLGRSFRSHILRRIIKYGTDNLALFGKIYQENHLVSVGVTRSIVTGKKIKIAGKDVNSNIELTKLLPLQLLNHNSYLFLYEGSKVRRQFIDWGLFHVEHYFLSLWRKVERILEQRNVAIRTKSSFESIKAWDKDLSQLGFELHKYRNQYIETFIPVVQEMLQQLLCDFQITISYFAGWDTTYDLETLLANNLKRDLQFGYTTIGPHRADLQLLVNEIPAKDALSRGQQKLLLYGLQIAQGIVLNKLTGKKCIYLIDDLLAELDLQKSTLLASILSKLEKAQIFATGLTRKGLQSIFAADINSKKVFCIDNGTIKIR